SSTTAHRSVELPLAGHSGYSSSCREPSRDRGPQRKIRYLRLSTRLDRPTGWTGRILAAAMTNVACMAHALHRSARMWAPSLVAIDPASLADVTGGNLPFLLGKIGLRVFGRNAARGLRRPASEAYAAGFFSAARNAAPAEVNAARNQFGFF